MPTADDSGLPDLQWAGDTYRIEGAGGKYYDYSPPPFSATSWALAVGNKKFGKVNTPECGAYLARLNAPRAPADDAPGSVAPPPFVPPPPFAASAFVPPPLAPGPAAPAPAPHAMPPAGASGWGDKQRWAGKPYRIEGAGGKYYDYSPPPSSLNAWTAGRAGPVIKKPKCSAYLALLKLNAPWAPADDAPGSVAPPSFVPPSFVPPPPFPASAFVPPPLAPDPAAPAPARARAPAPAPAPPRPMPLAPSVRAPPIARDTAQFAPALPASPTPVVDADGHKTVVVARIVDAQERYVNGKPCKVPCYQVRWQGCGPERDSWVTESDLLEDVRANELVAQYERACEEQKRDEAAARGKRDAAHLADPPGGKRARTGLAEEDDGEGPGCAVRGMEARKALAQAGKDMSVMLGEMER